MNIENKKYYTCKYDRPFKEIMLKENNKDLLKLLLEHILKVEVKEITILPTERNNKNINIKRKTFDALLLTSVGKIGIELNANYNEYVHPRNMAYLSDMYASHTLVGESYNEDVMIMQINLTFGLKDKKANRIYQVMDEDKKLFVKNFKIVEMNMDYYMDLWYNKNKKGIEENKILVMLGLEKEELKKLSQNDKVVSKFMEELNKVNENPEFRRYMTEEEDQRKIHNSLIKQAEKQGIKNGIEQGTKRRNIEIAKNLIKKNVDINIISESTGLSKEEIENLK